MMKRILVALFLAAFTGSLLASAEAVEGKAPETLEGVYRLGTLQSQGSTEYHTKEGIEVLMMYSSGRWVSVAYRESDKKAVFTSGGSFTFKNGVLTEKIEFHSVSLDQVGLESSFTLKFSDGKFHKSGMSRNWKVEENWLKIP